MGRSGLAILILASSAIAQLDGGTVVRHLKLRLKFANGACDPSAQVQLLGTSGPVANRRPDDQCEVEFVNVPTGTYNVEVSGQDFIQTDEIITAMNGITDFEVEVKARERRIEFGDCGTACFCWCSEHSGEGAQRV